MSSNSIRSKLIRVQIAVASAILLASCLAFLTHSVLTFENSMIRNAKSTAKILGLNLAPTISFMDFDEAKKILSSLKAEPMFIGAYIYDNNRALQANYGDSNDPQIQFPENLTDDQVTSDSTTITLVHPIQIDNESVGILVLKLTKEVLRAQYKAFALIVLLVFVVGLLATVFLATFTQRSLSRPVSALADFVRNIGVSKDYSMRFSFPKRKSIPAEIEVLSTEFNKMLSQIQARDLSIQTANEELEQKINERTEELKELQKVAVANARAAGISEIATGVLHNVGNITNSIGISAQLLSETLRESKITGLLKANELLDSQKDDLAAFFSLDPRGKNLPDYYMKIGEALAREHARLIEETKLIVNKSELINSVIHSQQTYAKGQLLEEDIDLISVLKELLSMLATMLNRHDVRVIEKYSRVPEIRIDRVKFSHVIINLIKNAKEAVQKNAPDNREIKIEIGRNSEGIVYLSITDNGEGILPENLHKIFSHGFTTKSHGHGFGLHFCANSMTEMGGNLVVESDGPGKGARFTILFDVANATKKQVS